MGEVVQFLGINFVKIFYFDDSVRNIFGGKRVGFYMVLVGSLIVCDGVDYYVFSIYNVREFIFEIWVEFYFFDEL